ncbi:MAG: YrdB family protein [Chloroflexi bacterium]|nr:YrdB family protein [Chloroflexota bacterium]
MSQNPLNLTLRFVLELAGLYAFGAWGWIQHAGSMRYLLVIVLPLIAGTLWGLFRVPGDASASGNAVVAVPGWMRLLMEIIFFSFATFCLLDAGMTGMGWGFGIASLFHYILSYDRVVWLLKS